MKYQAEHCPLCNEQFVCKVGNISQCQCARVELSNEVIRFLEDEFGSCLCIECLKQINSNKDLIAKNKGNLIKKVKKWRQLALSEK